MNKPELLTNLPLIDISIVTHNSAQWIENFFISLVNQSYPTKLMNIFLTDHESSDDTIKLSYFIFKTYSEKFNNFKIIERPNLGFGCGHNYNLSQGNAAYFLVSNVDLEIEHDAIYKAVNAAILDDDDVASWEFRQKPFEHPKYYNPVTLETYWSAHACILFRRYALECVKGYEERIFLYGEDVELSYRLRDNGFRLKYFPSSVCWHYTYEYANQVKRLQFLGSTLSNSYIRLRYGSFKEIAVIPLMYFRLWLSTPVIDNQRQAVLQNIWKLLQNCLYFLSTRKKSQELFPINNWDYGFIRDGAFYRYSRQIYASLPLVSVIIRTYKGRLSYLKEAVTSVLNQTYPNIELVVVEDGSDAAKNYLEQVANNSNLKVVYQAEPKRGRCYTGNVGLSKSSGKFLVFLDDDDLFFADHVEVLVNELLAHPEVAATYSIAWEVTIKLISLEPLSYVEVLHQAIYKQSFSRLLMLHHNYIPIQSILFDRKLYECHGGFDESLENLEDWNLWTRYCSNNDFLFIEKLTSMYRISANISEYIARQQSLDSYYKLAVEKQNGIKLTVTRNEIMNFYQEMIKHEQMNATARLRLKNFLFKYNFFKKIFYTLSITKRKSSMLRQ